MIQNTLNRRFFLQSCAAAAVGNGVVSGGPGLTGKIKIAVKYHMIDEPDLTVEEKFTLLRKIGFDGLEFKTKEKVDWVEVEKAIQTTGLPVHGIVNAGDTEISPAIETAHRLGAESVLVFAATQKNLSYEENFKFWQEQVQGVLPLAQEKNITICIENVRASFLNRAEEMARFIDSFQTDSVRSYFDLGNTITWSEQSAQHWAEVLGERFFKLDIKDRGHPVFGDAKLKKPGAQGTNGGEVHWQKVRQILVAENFSGWATAEVAGGNRARLAGIAEWMKDVLDLKSQD
ncbi:MAG: sugar phosphate isomerase/epimerase [Verrucomicrobiales bacterium]|nr:sugar phosphate isomerase/epimerase [Verrucomicrobiales bacterium]